MKSLELSLSDLGCFGLSGFCPPRGRYLKMSSWGTGSDLAEVLPVMVGWKHRIASPKRLYRVVQLPNQL